VWCGVVCASAGLHVPEARGHGTSSFMVMDVASDFRLQAVRTQDTTTTTLLLLLLRERLTDWWWWRWQDTLIWRGSMSLAGGIFSADRVR
jgi:hypothetical protein